MPTRLQTVPEQHNADPMAMTLGIEEVEQSSTVDRVEQLRKSSMYHQIVDYLQGGGETRLNEMGVKRNRRQALRHLDKWYRLPTAAEGRHLLYLEATGATKFTRFPPSPVVRLHIVCLHSTGIQRHGPRGGRVVKPNSVEYLV